MFANRLSFFFDFKGPSKAVDTGRRVAAAVLFSHLLQGHHSMAMSLNGAVSRDLRPPGWHAAACMGWSCIWLAHSWGELWGVLRNKCCAPGVAAEAFR